jgi:hypothetical protein
VDVLLPLVKAVATDGVPVGMEKRDDRWKLLKLMVPVSGALPQVL